MARQYPKLPQILYDNKVISAPSILTSAIPVAGHEVENLQDWKIFPSFKATSAVSTSVICSGFGGVNLNCWALVGHNLKGASSVSLLDSLGSPIAGSDIVVVPDNQPLIRFFDPTVETSFTFRINSPVNPVEIGCLFVGYALEIPAQIEAPFNPNDVSKMTNRDLRFEGQLVEHDFDYHWQQFSGRIAWLTKTWVDANLFPFFENHVPEPFIFAWNHYLQERNVAFVDYAPPRLGAPFDAIIYRSWDFNFQGAIIGEL